MHLAAKCRRFANGPSPSKYGITWPTGGGSICTGTLVVNACATSTGAPRAAAFFAPREQPPASIAAAQRRIIGKEKEFFHASLFHKIDFDARVAGAG